jgi:CelD/BcsL family acetyltransferase involved in cellulose biosynthesis
VSALRQERLDPLGGSRWVALLHRSSSAGPFHHPGWLKLLRDQYRYGIEALCVADGDGELLAGVPLAHVRSPLTGSRLVALPFSDTCPAAVADDAPEETTVALAGALEDLHAETGLDVELRSDLPGLTSAAAGPAFLQHVLKLDPDFAAVESRFAKSQIGRGIRKARREGVTVRFAADRDALDQFFRLHVRSRRQQGVPTQPKRFIRRFESLFREDLGWVALACSGRQTIAAAVFLSFNGTVIYKYGASDREQLHKRPNNLLFAEAIERACAEGAHSLDFGRTDLDNEGLAAFKRAWGAEERRLSYLRLGAEAGAGVPAPVQRLIWRSPPVVGRMIGAALYRHFG